MFDLAPIDERTVESRRRMAEEKRIKMEQQNKQRARKKTTSRLDAKSATFQHPWLNNTLKGHTGQVLNMDLSSNGKYLASCADGKLKNNTVIVVQILT